MTSASVRAQWERLIGALDAWTSAHEVSEGRIRVTLPGSEGMQEHVDVVMSPDDWDTLSSTICGSTDDAVDQVKRAVADLPSGHPFLIHDLYEFYPSTTQTLPPDPDEERIRQWMREHPGRPAGTWVAVGRDGKVYPFPEGPPR